MRGAAGWVAILAALTPSVLRAQDPVELGECEDMGQVVMTRVARIAGEGGRAPQLTEALARDARGRLLMWVPQSEIGGEVFADDGSFVGALEVPGPGPAPIISALVVSPGDTIHAFDRLRPMRYDFSPDLEFIGSRPLPGTPGFNKGAVRLAGGDWVLNANIETSERVGWPLHLLDDDGGVVRSFGSSLPMYRSDVVGSVDRSLAATGGGDLVWSARLTEYRLELWDASNELHQTLTRDAPWFQPWLRDNPIGPDAPRRPLLRDIWIDDDARLWTLITKASESYADFVEEREGGGYSWTSISGYHASVVEVIDSVAGCVTARGSTEAMLLASLGGGFYAGYEEDGVRRSIDVWLLEAASR